MDCEESLHESHAREDETIQSIKCSLIIHLLVEHVENLMNNQLEEAEDEDSQQNKKRESRNRRKKKRREKIALLP